MIRDPKWLVALRDYPCVLSFAQRNDFQGIDPAHVGVAGKGLKTDDCFCVPLRHDLHVVQHNKGWREVLARASWQQQREWLRAYGYTLWLQHKTERSLEDIAKTL